MNGLPNGVDAAMFLDAALMQICIGQNEVILIFDNDTKIAIESEVTTAFSHEKVERLVESPLIGAKLVGLLGKSVLNVEVLRRSDLKIVFDSGSITVHDSNSVYESFVISRREKTVVV